MNWWDLVAEKKRFPFAAQDDPEVRGGFRFPTAMLCLGSGVALIVFGIGALLFGSKEASLWAIGAALVLIVCGNILIPAERSRRKAH